jgi:hypothetical protein
VTSSTSPLNTVNSQGHFDGKPEVNTWEELKARVSAIRGMLPEYPNGRKPTLLFRGQANHEWKLASTLERRRRTAKIDCADYCGLAYSVRAEVEARSSLRFEYPSLEEIRATFTTAYEFATVPLPALVRTLDPPPPSWISVSSPLLDWTRNLYAAGALLFRRCRAPYTCGLYLLDLSAAAVGLLNVFGAALSKQQADTHA